MMEWVGAPGLAPLETGLLIAASFITSFITAAFGIGGGLALLSLMAQSLAPAAIIPIHAAIQLASNAGRMALLWREITGVILLPFALGAVIGAAIGGAVAVNLPSGIMQLLLGLFILIMVWGPKPPAWVQSAAGLAGVGLISSMVTMFVGATGPFIAAAIKPLGLSPARHMASFSAAMTVQHGVKILVFGILGFGFAPYAGLICAMVITGFLGTWAGTRLMRRRTIKHFQLWLSIILSALALRLIYLGALDLPGSG